MCWCVGLLSLTLNAAVLLNQGDLDGGDVFVRAATEVDGNDCMTLEMQVMLVGVGMLNLCWCGSCVFASSEPLFV